MCSKGFFDNCRKKIAYLGTLFYSKNVEFIFYVFDLSFELFKNKFIKKNKIILCLICMYTVFTSRLKNVNSFVRLNCRPRSENHWIPNITFVCARLQIEIDTRPFFSFSFISIGHYSTHPGRTIIRVFRVPCSRKKKKQQKMKRSRSKRPHV